MKEQEILQTSNMNSFHFDEKPKKLCEKCGGNGNLQTPENSRRTCLACFGKGYLH